MPAPSSVQAATLNKFITGWKEGTYEGMTRTWSDDCQQRMLPLALGFPPRSKEEVSHVLPQLLSVLKNYKVEVYEVVHDAERGKAVIYLTSTADTPWEDFKWNNEYSVFVTFTEDGKQINKMEEMVDTALFKEFSPRFQKYLSEQKAPDGKA